MYNFFACELNSMILTLLGRRQAATTTARTLCQLRHMSKDTFKKGGAGEGGTTTYGNYQFQDSIERGRQQYSIRNGLVAVGLVGGVAAIYFYSLHAVKQEDFSDVPMPPEPSTQERLQFEKKEAKAQ